MSNVVEMSKDEVRELSIDFDSHQACQDGVATLSGKVAGRDKRNARAKYVIAMGADRMVVDHGMTAENVASVVGMAPGTFSKLRTVARVVRYAVSERGDESPYDEVMADAVAKLQRFWDLETNGQDAGSLLSALLILSADDGENRADGVARLYGVFGSTEAFYNVLKGKAVHADDEPVVEDGEGDDPDDGDDEPTSGLEMISQAIGVARSQGVSDADIAAHVMRVLGV